MKLPELLRRAVASAAVAIPLSASTVPILDGAVGVSSAEARDSRVSKEDAETINRRLREIEVEFFSKFKDRFGFEITLKFNGESSGEIGIFKKGEEDGDKLAGYKYGDLRANSVHIFEQITRRMTALDVAGLILEKVKEPLSVKVETTRIEIGPYTLGMMDIAGAKLSEDGRYFISPDGAKKDLTLSFAGSYAANKNVTVELMSALGVETPTILACTLNKFGNLEGYQIVLGDSTVFTRMPDYVVQENCRK